MPEALGWLDIARDCFDDEYGSLQRGLLTSIFAPVIGLERVFHLQEMQDPGFAVLTGGRRCPPRHLVGGWRRHLPWYEVDRFCRRTYPWELIRGRETLISYDEHAIPRWTKKFRVPKGYVTTRNKYMRCEKLYYGYDVEQDRCLSVFATRGNVELRHVSERLVRQTLEHGQPKRLHALFDAGAGKSDADVRRLLDLAEQNPNLDVTLRACRYPARLPIWKQLPADQFVSYEEPGRYVDATPREVRVAETRTTLKGEDPSQAPRTIVCRDVIPGPKKDRWHPLYTTSKEGARQVVETFRKRQHQEQNYRVEVHDAFINAAPCAYDKQSPDPNRPRFHRGPLQMIGCLTGLIYNAVADLASRLPSRFHGAFLRTIRRTFLNRPARLYLTPTALIVHLEPFAGQDDLIPLIDAFNARQQRLPWLNHRIIVLSSTPLTPARSRAGP